MIGILENTGGITEHLNAIVSFVQKETGAVLISNPDPVELLDRLEEIYKTSLLPKYQHLVRRRNLYT